MPHADKIAVALVVAPEPDELVAATADDGLAVAVHGERVDLVGVRAVNDTDGLAVERIPVRYLSVEGDLVNK